MEEILKFFNQFLEDEYKINKARYDVNISQERCNQLAGPMSSYFHSIVKPAPDYNRSDTEFGNEIKKMLAGRKVEMMTSRILFQIKQYQNPTYGDALRRVVISKKLYRCYVSSDQNTGGIFSKFSRSYFIAETDEGLKIIYMMYFEDGDWRQMHGYEPTQIIDPGKVVEVKIFQEPEEAYSLADYKAE